MDSAEFARRWHGLAIIRFIACLTVVGLLTVGLVPVMGKVKLAAAVEPAMWVSARPDGSEPAGVAYQPSISADGNLVAFWGNSSDLVSGDTNNRDDMFVRDLTAGTITRASVSSTGAQANNGASTGEISADGTKVAFVSSSTNLVTGDTNGKFDIFVRDLTLGTTERVSVSSAGVEGNGHSAAGVSISADGRFVGFRSDASNLVAGDTNGKSDAFVRDRQAGTTTRVSVSSSGAQGDNASQGPMLSANGQFVAFESQATNLVTGDTNAVADMFVHDLSNGETERVSVGSAGGRGNGPTDHGNVALSADGRFVTFASGASNMVGNDTNNSTDVFLRDRQSGTTERVSLSTTGRQGDSSSVQPSISSDGRFVAFVTFAPNLVSGDTNGVEDVVIRDRQIGERGEHLSTRPVDRLTTGPKSLSFPLTATRSVLRRCCSGGERH
jgi:hypothetical protein